MKKIFNIISLVAVAAFTLISCQKQVEPHQPGPAEVSGCYGVYFPTQAAAGSHVYNPTQDPSVEITLARTNTSGAITVPVKATYSEDGIFTMSDATFADGQSETTFVLRFDNAVEGTNYSASFEIDDNQYASLYNSNPIALDFSVMRVEMKYFMNPVTGEKARIHWTQGWWGEEVDTYLKYYEVNGIRTCFTETIPDSHYSNSYYTAYGFFGTGAAEGDYEWTFYLYTKNSNPDGNPYIRMALNNTGYHHSTYDADVYAMDYFYYNSSDDVVNDDSAFLSYAADNSEVVSYYDGNGGFYLSMRSYYMFGIGGWDPGAYDVVGISEGFTRVDYSLEAEADYSYDGVTPIYLEAGLDVAGVKYAVYEGELTATQIANKVAAITDGTDASELFTDFEIDEEEAIKYGALGVSPEATGMYTFVAVAIDEAYKAQTSASASFKFVSAEDQEELEVDMYVFTEDTPARYTTLHDYDSFAFGIYGTDLAEVHCGIFDMSKIPSLAEAALVVKQDTEGDYLVSESVLAKINSLGGYYDVATPVNAKTTYVVIVWATNGSLDTYKVATYTTGKLPYVWESLGTGTYTEDVAGGVYEVGPIDVDCNVFEEKSTPGFYMINGFQKNYIQTLFDAGAFGDDMIGESAEEYEGILWRDVDLIIDATNPNDVVIELQDYGICLSPSDGFIDGLTSRYKGEAFSVGTLEDGVISFPEPKGLLCLIDGDGYYYANQDGAFKLVLPGVEAETANAVTSFANKVNRSVNKSNMAKGIERPVYERDPKPVQLEVSDVIASRKSHEKGYNKPISK